MNDYIKNLVLRLSDRRRYRRLVYFFNIFSCSSPAYLCSLLSDKQRSSLIGPQKRLFACIRPKQCNIYNIIDPSGLKLFTRLRVNLSLVREHKFRHNFRNTLNPLCSCSLEIESTSYYLLRCHFFTHIQRIRLDNIIDIIGDISNFSDDELTNLLLYGNKVHNVEVNASILKNTIIFLKTSETFDVPRLYISLLCLRHEPFFFHYFILNVCAVPHQ